MAREPPKGSPPASGFAARMSERLGRPPARAEGQYIVGAYALVTVVLLLAPFVTTELPNPSGQPAPDFSLPTTTGSSYHLASDIGQRPVLLEFMHPQCPHCVNMASHLETAYTTYQSQVHFVSVAIPLASFGTPSMGDVQAFQNQYGHPWTYCLDESGSVPAAYGVSGTPTFFFISINGTVSASAVGELTDAQLAQYLQGLLGG